MPNNDSHQHVVKTSAQWNERAVEYWIVPRGCLCIELTPDGKTKIKIGEGNKYYAQLPYITSEADLTQYYTKEEINILFENLNRMAIMSTDEYDDKEELPLDGNKLGDVRFVKSSSPSIKIDPDIYLWNGTKWIFVGYEFKDVDLSKYLKKEEFHELFDPVKEKVDEMYPKMHTHSNKEILDQITAPFTIPEKEKLAGLENYDDTEIRELIHESSHTHDNKDILDTITSDSLWSQTDRNKFNNLHNYDDGPITERVADLEDKAHTHTNKEFLDTIAMPYQIWSQEDREKFDSLSNPEVFIGTDGQYPGRKGLVPAPTITDIGKFLSSSGHWLSIEGSTDFVGATADTGGVHGLVPAPMAGQNTYFLRGDGTWAEVSGGGGGGGSAALPDATGTVVSSLARIKNAPGIYAVKGTQSASTSVWTGNIDVSELYNGLTIAYYLPYSSTTTSVTLNLTLTNGSTTGAVNCYVNGTTRITNQYAAGSVITLTYWSAGSIGVNGTATTDNRWVHCG